MTLADHTQAHIHTHVHSITHITNRGLRKDIDQMQERERVRDKSAALYKYR